MQSHPKPPTGSVRRVFTHLMSIYCYLVLVAEMEFAKFLIAKEQSVSINAFCYHKFLAVEGCHRCDSTTIAANI